MALRYVIGDLRTGRRLLDLPVVSGPWERNRNGPGTISPTVNLADPRVRALDLPNVTAPGKSFCAVLDGETFLEAGPIWRRNIDTAKRQLQLHAVGMWSYFDHRTILPLIAQSAPFYVPDPADDAKPGDTVPNPALDTNLNGLALGTIGKRWIQQARAWTGGDVPIVFVNDMTGPHERNVKAVELKILGSMLEDLTQAEDGPDIEFRPRWTPDMQGVEWVYRHGSNSQPRLRSMTVHRWDFSVDQPAGRNLTIDEDATQMVDTVWTTGGRSANVALVEYTHGDVLTKAGYPTLEDVDSTHSTVSDPKTLEGFGRERIRVDSRPRQFFSFETNTRRSPYLNDINVGDLTDIIIGRHDWLSKGTYRTEIASMSGDHMGRFVTIRTGEVLG